MRKALVATGSALVVAVLLGCGGHWYYSPPKLWLSTDTLTFDATEGGANPAAQDVTAANVGSDTISWVVSCDEPWLQVSPRSGTSTSEWDTLTVSAVIDQAEAWLGATSTSGATARESVSAVWTGTEMIVWGGNTGGAVVAIGEVYDPATDQWLGAISTEGAPTARWGHTAVWTGIDMIVWGGCSIDYAVVHDTGGRYDPVTDDWTGDTSTVGAPRRWCHSAVWTGAEMIVWGGFDDVGRQATGYRYDPTADSWLGLISQVGAPDARSHHSGVWTGEEMVVWGGRDGANEFNTGGRYDPSANAWGIETSIAGAPAVRWCHSAVWTGTEMIVWGGGNVGQTVYLDSGGRYDPVADTWSTTTTSGAPSKRRGHAAVWTGTEMIVWGGYDGSNLINTGARYRPPISLTADTYTATITVSAPGVSNSPQTVEVTLTVAPP